MSDLQLPPSAPQEPPKWMKFPRDMEVAGDQVPAAWAVTVAPGMVWLWIRQPTNVFAHPFDATIAAQLGAALSDEAVKASDLRDQNRLIQVKAPILGPNGTPIG